MANQSSFIFYKNLDHQSKESKISIGLSKSLTNYSLEPKKMDSTRILSLETIDTNQDHKRRCFEQSVVRRARMMQRNNEDVKCALEAEVVDDTAFIDATFAVNGFKNHCRIEKDAVYGNRYQERTEKKF